MLVVFDAILAMIDMTGKGDDVVLRLDCDDEHQQGKKGRKEDAAAKKSCT